MTDQTGEGMAEATPSASEFDNFSAVYDKFSDQIEDMGDAPEAEEQEAPQEAPSGPERGPDGKFKAREPAGEVEAVEAEPEAIEAREIPAPPAHLLGPIKEAWGNLPDGVRDAIVKQQQDVDRKFGEVGQAVRAMKPVYEQVDAIFREFPEFQRLPQDQRIEGLRRLAAVQSMMENDPVGTWMQVAEQYGLTPHLKERLTGETAADSDKQSAQYVAELNHKISQLERQLAQAADPERVGEIVSRQFEEREILRSVQEFATSKDLYPAVEPYLPHFIKMVHDTRPDLSSPQAVLNEAYDMAVNAIPAAREKLREATAKAAAPAPDPKRAESAKRAAAVNLRGRDATKPRPKNDREAFEEVWSKHGLG